MLLKILEHLNSWNQLRDNTERNHNVTYLIEWDKNYNKTNLG